MSAFCTGRWASRVSLVLPPVAPWTRMPPAAAATSAAARVGPAGVEERGSADSSGGDAGVLEDLTAREPSALGGGTVVVRHPNTSVYDANLKWPTGHVKE